MLLAVVPRTSPLLSKGCSDGKGSVCAVSGNSSADVISINKKERTIFQGTNIKMYLNSAAKIERVGRKGAELAFPLSMVPMSPHSALRGKDRHSTGLGPCCRERDG